MGWVSCADCTPHAYPGIYECLLGYERAWYHLCWLSALG